MSFTAFDQFLRGIVEDGDPTNTGATLVELVNLDIIRSDNPTPDGTDTILRVRPAFDFYSENGFSNDHLPGNTNGPAVGGKAFYKAWMWQSGVRYVSVNLLLAYREFVSGDTYSYTFYTNAPALSAEAEGLVAFANGGVNEWWMMEANVYAPAEIFVYEEAGRIRVTLGNTDLGSSSGRTNDYRILVDLAPNGSSRHYCSNALTIYRATDLNKTLGAGGYVKRGWLWDYGYLYDPFKLPGSTGNQIGVQIQGDPTSTDALDADWSVIVAPVWDGDPEQIGGAYVKTFKKDVDKTPILINLGPYSGYIFSPRITGFAIYGKRTNHASGDMTDWLRVATVPINSLPTTSTTLQYTLNNDSLLTGEGAWGPDTQNRSVLPNGSSAGQRSTSDDVWYFTVKPRGFAMRKETVFAWGTATYDQSQSLIRVSAMNGSRGQYDVFPYDQGTWKGGVSMPINCLIQWDDRIVQFHDTALFHLEPQDDIRARESYLHGSDSFGYGLPIDFIRTLVRGKEALYFANDYGIYAFRTGRVDNLLDGKRFRRWAHLLTPEARRTAVAGFYPFDEELWVAIQTTYGDDDSWVIWVYRDDGSGISSWRDYRISSVIPGGESSNYIPAKFFGFICDVEKSWFLPYGTFHSQTTALTNVFMQFNPDDSYTKRDFETRISSGAASDARDIGWSAASKFQGARVIDTLLDAVDIQSLSTENLTLQLYGNDSDTPWHTRLISAVRYFVITLKEMRCYNWRWRLSGSYAGGTARSELRSVAFDIRPAPKRRK